MNPPVVTPSPQSTVATSSMAKGSSGPPVSVKVASVTFTRAGPVNVNPPVATMGASVTVNGSGLVATPNSTTVMAAGPPWSGADSSATNDAGTVAFNWVELTNVVDKA